MSRLGWRGAPRACRPASGRSEDWSGNPRVGDPSLGGRGRRADHRQEALRAHRFLLGDAVVTPVGGMHVHVGMPDAETAIRTFNGLRRDLALLQALAANSPFRHGRDTGLASSREVPLRAWPRSGAPRAMGDFQRFPRDEPAAEPRGGCPDYTWFWWKLRSHPRLGTVEIRSLDAQTSLADAAALVALVHCLARDARKQNRPLS